MQALQSPLSKQLLRRALWKLLIVKANIHTAYVAACTVLVKVAVTVGLISMDTFCTDASCAVAPVWLLITIVGTVAGLASLYAGCRLVRALWRCALSAIVWSVWVLCAAAHRVLRTVAWCGGPFCALARCTQRALLWRCKGACARLRSTAHTLLRCCRTLVRAARNDARLGVEESGAPPCMRRHVFGPAAKCASR